MTTYCNCVTCKLLIVFVLFNIFYFLIKGFGRSSRPDFSKDGDVAERQFVKSIEEWRKEANIKEMILLGHSMGGFLGCAYALAHPNRVKHLVGEGFHYKS